MNGRPPKLDHVKQRELCALIQVGCSRTSAARHVGCTLATLRNTAQRDPAFAEALRKAIMLREVNHLQNIRDGAKRSWKASAWYLERSQPESYGRRRPDTIEVGDLGGILQSFVDELFEEPAIARHRLRIARRLERFVTRLRATSRRRKRKE